MIVRPADRDLEPDELVAYVSALTRRPALWEHAIRHEPDRRTYELLHRDPYLAVWLICWSEDADTGFHDHDLSAGAVSVVDGAVREERLNLGGAPSTEVFSAGAAFGFEPGDIHRVRHAGTEPAVTLHAYSPPLWRMGAYLVEDDGRLRREPLSYAEELRPLAPA